MARHGGKKKPFYHITVAEKSAQRDGRFIERIGFYNPLARGKDEELRLDGGRFNHWVDAGAQPTDRVRQLAKRWHKEQASAVAAQADAAPAEVVAEAPAPAEATVQAEEAEPQATA